MKALKKTKKRWSPSLKERELTAYEPTELLSEIQRLKRKVNRLLCSKRVAVNALKKAILRDQKGYHPFDEGIRGGPAGRSLFGR